MNQILKIDIDTKPFKRRAFDHDVVMLAKELGVKKTTITLKSTRKGTHALVELHDIILYPELVVACQLYLGSDRERELFNIGRIDRGELESWNVLFSSKWKNNKRISKETNVRTYEIKTGGNENGTSNTKTKKRT